MWNLKMILQMSLFTTQKQTHRLREELMVTFRKCGVRDRSQVWDGHVHGATFETGNRQGPTV